VRNLVSIIVSSAFALFLVPAAVSGAGACSLAWGSVPHGTPATSLNGEGFAPSTQITIVQTVRSAGATQNVTSHIESNANGIFSFNLGSVSGETTAISVTDGTCTVAGKLNPPVGSTSTVAPSIVIANPGVTVPPTDTAARLSVAARQLPFLPVALLGLAAALLSSLWAIRRASTEGRRR
jgi:hypothetical protein